MCLVPALRNGPSDSRNRKLRTHVTQHMPISARVPGLLHPCLAHEADAEGSINVSSALQHCRPRGRAWNRSQKTGSASPGPATTHFGTPVSSALESEWIRCQVPPPRHRDPRQVLPQLDTGVWSNSTGKDAKSTLLAG